MFLEMIGWISVGFTIVASGYLAVHQRAPFLVWFCWTVGASLALLRTLILGDLPNSGIYIVLDIANGIGIYRWWVKRRKTMPNENTTQEEADK